MSESLGDAVLTLRTDDKPLDDGLRRGERKAEATAAKFTAIGGRMKDVGTKLSVAMTLPIGAFALASANAASDAQELQSAFDVTFGQMAGDMNEWARVTGDAMGRSTQEMQKAANTFGMFFNQAAPTKQVAADMAQQFTVLAQDLSSFYNVDPGEALAKLRSGLSGETEPLRDFGVFINEATMKAKAMELGLTSLGGELSEQQKIMVRAAIIMDATKNAQGDVARTASGTANQVRAANAAWEELQVTIGTKLLPIFTPLITAASSVLNAITALPAPVQTTIAVVAALAAALGPLLIAFGLMSTGIGALVPVIGGLSTAFTVARIASLALLPTLAPFLVPLAAIAAAVGAVWLAWKNWDRIAPVLSGVIGSVKALYTGVKEWLQNKLTAVLDWVNKRIQSVADKFKWLWDVVVGHSYVPDLVDGIAREFDRLDGEMVKPAEDAADRVAEAMAGIPTPSIDVSHEGGHVDAPSGMPGAAQEDWRDGVRRSFKDGIRAALDGDLMGFFARWMEDGASRALDRALDLVFDALGDIGGSGKGGIGGLLSGLFGTFAGGFAKGGLIPSGKFGLVGEDGPELAIASPKGTLIRPNSSLSGASMRPAAGPMQFNFNVDATGADAAAIGRLNAQLDRMRAELPATIVRTTQDAGERGMINPRAWR